MNDHSPKALELRDYLKIVRRRKWYVLLPAIAVVAATLAASLTTTPVYQASVDILVESKQSSVLPDMNIPVQDPQRTLQTQMQVILSRPIAEEVVKRLDLPDSPESIQARTSAQVVGQTQIIRIRARDTSPDLARDLANAIAGTYSDFRRKAALESFATQAEDIRAKIDEATAAYQQADADLQDAIAETRGEKGDVGASAKVQSLSNKREQAAQLQSFWKTALDKLQIQTSLQTESATLVAPAVLPTAPIEPKPTRNATLALVIGLLLGVALAFLVEYLDDSLHSRQDAESAFKAPILGMVPKAPAWKNSDEAMLMTLRDPASTLAEAYRSVRTNLQFALLDSNSRVVLVTSPSVGEGKSTTAANMAVVLAQSGKTVIIVDCDLRRPRVHKFFQLRNSGGVTTAILAERPLVDLLQRPRIAGAPASLLALTSGPIPPNPADLLGSARMSELTQTLSTLADYVIIDTPPVVPLSDAAVLAPRADGCVLVAEAGRSSKRASAQAREKLDAVGAKVLGIVLNEVTPEFGEPGYYYDYYFYYSDYRTAAEQAQGNGDKKRRSKRGGKRSSGRSSQRQAAG